jgi:uncharacterized membrane protein YedE/YeeE
VQDFTPIASSIGGLLIGLGAAIMLLFNGRIAGISGIFEGFVVPDEDVLSWRTAFIGGLFAGGLLMSWFMSPSWFEVTIQRSTLTFFVGGLLVGFGTRLGNGCTSGHGVCGISRFSRRSIVATLSFMLSGFVTVYVVQHLLGGAS